MNLFLNQKETHQHRKQTYDYQTGKGSGGRYKLQCSDLFIHTTTYKIGNQQAQGNNKTNFLN